MTRENEAKPKSAGNPLAFLSRRQQMGWAALIMGVSVLLSRFMGLIRDKVISYLFGATSESDLYFAAFVIPDFLNYLLAGAYFSITLIPLLTAYFEKDEEDGWRFFSTVFTWVALSHHSLHCHGHGTCSTTRPPCRTGAPEDSLTRLAFFLRIILPAQICFLLGSCITAILYLRKQFLVPGSDAADLQFHDHSRRDSPAQPGYGRILLGCVWSGPSSGTFACLIWRQDLDTGLKLRFSLYHPGLKRFFLLALPLMLGQSVVVLDEQLVRVFGSLAGIGAISWLNYARRIMLVPVGSRGSGCRCRLIPIPRRARG